MLNLRAAYPLVATLVLATSASLALADDSLGDVRERGSAEKPTARDDGHLFDHSALRFDAAGLEWKIGAFVTGSVTARGHRFAESDRYGTSVDDLRPLIDAASDQFSFHIEGDAIGVDTPRNLYEAWAAWTPSPAVRVSAGQFRVALGSEFGTHEKDLPFVGYGFTSQLDGRYDTGLRVDGSPTAGLWYQATAVTGHGFNLEGDRLTGPQASLRVVTAPFLLADSNVSNKFLRGFYLGAAGAYRGDADDPLSITTPLQSVVVKSPDLGGDSGTFVHLEAGCTVGPVQLGFEKVVGRINGVDVPGGETDLDNLGALTWFAAWNMTGESRGWRDGTWTRGTECPGGRQCAFLPEGQWELAGRFSNVNIHRDLFNAGILTRGGGDGGRPNMSGSSTWQTHTYTAALFWRPSPDLRLGAEMVKSVTEDRMAIFGGTKYDTSFVLSVQLQF